MFGREFTESGIALQFCKKKIDILESISVVSAVAGLGPCRTPIAKFLKIFLGNHYKLNNP